MRFLMVALVWVAFVGGLALYMRRRPQPAPMIQLQPTRAGGMFSLEITTSATLQPDPFALQTKKSSAPALLVRANGREISRLTQAVPGGSRIGIIFIPGIVQGENEFYIEANPPLAEAGKAFALRLRLLRDEHPVAGGERTLWSEPGWKIATTFSVTIAAPEVRQHDHSQ